MIENQRDRIYDSLGEVCATKGYREMTVEDIIGHAGVSRRTFYDLFDDKEQCFLAAYDRVVDRLYREVSHAYSVGERPWPERIAAGLRALVDVFAAEPELARLAVVEVLAAGKSALQRRNSALRSFTIFLEPGGELLPAGVMGQEVLVQAVVGGLYEVLYAYVAEGKTARLPAILPDLVYCALTPFVGHHGAIATRDKVRDQGRRGMGQPA